MKAGEVHVEELQEWAAAAGTDGEEPVVELHVLAQRWELRCGEMAPLAIEPVRP